MSELRFETFTMPAGGIGPESPHPQFGVPPPPNAPDPAKIDPGVPPEEARYIRYGMPSNCLPYKLQDDLSRQREPRAFDVAVLENETLRATFLLEMGGRLWSLIHKPSGRELLFRNPVFQPGNLGLRVAWFSGGVEWNFCWAGHTPLTCERLFAARTRLPDGTPVLRLYEYERVRGLAYQIDCFLPDGSEALLVRVALRNPDDRTVPVYWWSNMAVPDQPGGRVIVPAESLLHFAYDTGWMSQFPHPRHEGVDRSYPVNIPIGNDDFYVIPPDRQPWITALDAEGRGLFQASTGGLRGRKLFVWGQLPACKHWQEFLNTPGHEYVEIQAGLERTQGSCRPLPGGATFEWLEAYGLMEAEPGIVHGPDWEAAWRHTGARLARSAALPALERMLEATRPMSLAAPEEVVRRGSGWGALERVRRERGGERPFCGPSLVFDDASLGPEQAPWLALLKQGGFPSAAPQEAPGSYMIQEAWLELLKASMNTATGQHWGSLLQLGVMHLAHDRYTEARSAWEQSLRHTENVWALRNLACLATMEKRQDEAMEGYRRAVRLAPDDWRLTVEYATALVFFKNPVECLALIDAAPAATRRRNRVRMLRLWAVIELDQLDVAAGIMGDPSLLEDAREGDGWTAELWYTYKAKCMAKEEGIPCDDALMDRVRNSCAPPRHMDYRMANTVQSLLG
jgi:tetratricopeptide (TPR) repeat protein